MILYLIHYLPIYPLILGLWTVRQPVSLLNALPLPHSGVLLCKHHHGFLHHFLNGLQGWQERKQFLHSLIPQRVPGQAVWRNRGGTHHCTGLSATSEIL